MKITSKLPKPKGINILHLKGGEVYRVTICEEERFLLCNSTGTSLIDLSSGVYIATNAPLLSGRMFEPVDCELVVNS